MAGRRRLSPHDPPAHRGGRARLPALLHAARGAAQRGESIVVFPQGSILGIEVGFRPGALRLARALGLPVLPVVISGSHRVWEHPFSPRLRLGQPVTATILPPIEVVGLDRSSLGAAMAVLERRMKEVALAPGHAAPRHYDPERDGTWDGYDFVIDPAFRDVAGALPHRVRVGKRHARSASAPMTTQEFDLARRAGRHRAGVDR